MVEIKGKTWYRILSPKIFKEKEIGETLANSSDSLKGRQINITFSDLTGDLTKHYARVKLKIIDVKGDHAYTEFLEYELSKPYLTRLTRRRLSKIDVVKDVKLKDGDLARIKTLILTAHRANTRQRTAVRNIIQQTIEKKFNNMDKEVLINLLISDEMQRTVATIVKKIYPLRFLEIRKVEFKSKKKEAKAQ